MLQSFFDYSDQVETQQTQDLVFLPEWEEAKWKTLLKHAELRRFKAGDLVVRYGDTDRTFYIIIEGKLEVLIPQGNSGHLRLAAVYDAGIVVGEQAFLDGKPRSATLRAAADGVLLSVSIDAFNTLAAHEPELARDILMDLARTLSVKLRRASIFISNLLN
jgi:CRP-like cAMP-binding protein